MQRLRPNNPTRRAFTLTELLVAIGAVAILTVGVGRIFASINGLVATGIAVAEVDQVARTIEQRLREDLEALSDMDPDETYIAIRMREIGHPDRPIYLSADDREADIRAGISPYEEGSRAVYRRLDEIVFLAGGQSGSRSFASAQPDGFFTQASPTAEYARIYWGHGLKPKPNPNWPDTDPAKRFPTDLTAERIPPRLWEPDGYFGDRAGANDPSTLNPTEPRIYGRNEYAAEWTLARQPLLLLGPNASGESERDTGPFPVMAGIVGGRLRGVGGQREYAPYIRDIETFQRVWPALGLASASDFNVQGNSETWPDPRLIRHGRVDILAQSLDGVRRFLEGELHEDNGGAQSLSDRAVNAWPFEPGVGRLGRDPDGPGDPYGSELDLELIQQALWRWPRMPTDPNNPNKTRPQAWSDYQVTLREIRSALAGTIIRPLVEPEPPVIDHVLDDSTNIVEGPENSVMDNHAVIAPRCSSFAIAWSDGTVVIEQFDINNDGKPEYFPGDRVWFDITRLSDDDPNIWAPAGAAFRATLDEHPKTQGVYRWERGEPPAPFNSFAVFEDRELAPSVRFDLRNVFMNTVTGLNPGPDARRAYYNPDMTGGLPSWLEQGGASGAPDGFEHLVIFPFRDSVKAPPSATDFARDVGVGFTEDSQPWPKPKYIRIRMTLHDSNNRIEGGKEYEFIFPVNLND